VIDAGGARKSFGIGRQAAMRWRPENCSLAALGHNRAWRNGCGFLCRVWLFGIGRDLPSLEIPTRRFSPKREVDEEAVGMRVAARY
jgi:hypothetical protein